MTQKEILFEFVRGDTFDFTFEFVNPDVVLDSCYFSCKECVNDLDYVFQKSLNKGISKQPDGKYRVRIERDDTIDMKVGLCYHCDLQIERGGVYLTPIKAKIKLLQDVTR